MNATGAFREAFAVTNPLDTLAWSSFAARRSRYEVLWAFFENSAYSNAHLWAASLRSAYGLYEYTRGVYNPAYPICRWWRTHLMGGALDPLAGNDFRTSALPIITDNEKLRGAIATLWQASNWGKYKDEYTLTGTVDGDVGLRVIDDPQHRRVYLNVVNPGTVKDVELDARGFVKGYVFQEMREDPRPSNTDRREPQARPRVVYNEVVGRDGDDVVYQTYLDGKLYAWPEHVSPDGQRVAEWEEPYGFVPLVMVKHFDVGLAWGWSELNATLPNIREVDDLGSKLNDQIRKTVDAKWAFIGIKKGEIPTVKGRAKTDENDQPGREEEGAYYLPVGGDVKPMVAPLDIAATSAHILTILSALERKHPEVDPAIYAPQAGDPSGYALRQRRQPVEDKALDYRNNYDGGAVQAQQMAIAIGGFRGYPGYEGFDLKSFERGRDSKHPAGALSHSIGPRPVFKPDEVELIALENSKYSAIGAAETAEMPVELVLEKLGYSKEQVQQVLAFQSGASGAARSTGGQLSAIKTAVDNQLAKIDPGTTDVAPADAAPVDPSGAQSSAVATNDLRQTVGGSAAVREIQLAYYSRQLPRDAAVANAVIIFGFKQEEAERLFPEMPPDAPAAKAIPGTQGA